MACEIIPADISCPTIYQAVIAQMQAHFAASLPWLQKIYPLVDTGIRNEGEKRIRYPRCFVAQDQYRDLFPSDETGTSYCFFKVVGSPKYDLRNNITTYSLKVIFFVDQRDYQPTEADYTNTFIQQLFYLADQGFNQFALEVQSEIEKDKVWSDYDYDFAHLRLVEWPYTTFSLTFSISVESDISCFDCAAFQVEPILVPQGANDFIHNQETVQILSNFNISGKGKADILEAREIILNDPLPPDCDYQVVVLDCDNKMKVADLPIPETTDDLPEGAINQYFTDQRAIDAGTGEFIPLSEKGAALGVGTLDASGVQPDNQINPALLGNNRFKGFWNATTNIITSSDLSIDGLPMPAAAPANMGWNFIVQVAGTTSIDGVNDWGLGDWIISSGAAWTKVDNTDSVISVNGFIGVVVLTTTHIAEGTGLYHTAARVLAVLLTGFAVGANAAIAATDTILEAFGKAQAQINAAIRLYFTESRNTAAPNATIPVHQIAASGAETNIDVALTPKGTGGVAAHVANNAISGGNKRGNYAVDWQTIRLVATRVASGLYSVISGGYSNLSSGSYSTVGGGALNQSTGVGATIVGGEGNVADADYSMVSGGLFGIVRGIKGVWCFPGMGASGGQNQTEMFILRMTTTNTTPAVLTTNAGAAGTTNLPILPNSSAYYIKLRVIARDTAAANSVKSWFVDVLIKRDATAASTNIIGAPVVTNDFGSVAAATWAVAVTADTTNGGLQITVTGQTSTTIRWSAICHSIEVT